MKNESKAYSRMGGWPSTCAVVVVAVDTADVKKKE